MEGSASSQNRSSGCSSLLTPVLWDSDHFGYPVGFITGPDVGENELQEQLDYARHGGVRLVYWATWSGRPVSASVLRTHGGLLVDRKATFRMDLDRDQGVAVDPASLQLGIQKQPRGPAPGWLLRLGVAAGQFSRFQVDRNIPRERFEALYETWVDRSAQGDLADAVLVACQHPPSSEGCGMVTIALREGIGKISLIAVAESWRGRGVGRFLVAAAHRWMAAQGARQAVVVTQLANQPACRLYQSCGYSLDVVQDFYHFWPLEAPEARLLQEAGLL